MAYFPLDISDISARVLPSLFDKLFQATAVQLGSASTINLNQIVTLQLTNCWNRFQINQLYLAPEAPQKNMLSCWKSPLNN